MWKSTVRTSLLEKSAQTAELVLQFADVHLCLYAVNHLLYHIVRQVNAEYPFNGLDRVALEFPCDIRVALYLVDF